MKSAPTRLRMPGDPDRVYASMGNYIFSTDLLLRELYADAANESARTISDATFCRGWLGAPTCSPTIFKPITFRAIR